MIWLDIEGTQYWKGQDYNRQFFAGLVQGAQMAGVNLGIYTSASQWIPIMGGSTAGSPYPLWYAHCTSQNLGGFRLCLFYLSFCGLDIPHISLFWLNLIIAVLKY